MKKSHQGFSLIEYMIALSLGMLLCAGIFSIFNAIEVLHRREVAMSNAHNDMEFITQFLREKIHRAGDWSCESTPPISQSRVVQVFDSEAAERVLGVRIKSGTQLLQLQECIRFHDQMQYLPIAFFIANTHRTSLDNKNINALFIQVGDHRREELITGMVDFQLHLEPNQENHVAAVLVNYILSSVDEDITASNDALYTPGILYTVVQNELP